MNEVVSTFYMVRNNFYTYGFDSDTFVPIYTEYYQNALKEIYDGAKRYLSECNTKNPILIQPISVVCSYVKNLWIF